MNQTDETRPSYNELEDRLLEMEQVVAALRDHQVDAIVGESDVAMVHLRQVEEALRDSGERYRAFVANSSEGIGRYEIEPPMPVSLTDEEQVDYILEHNVVGECNDAMARLAGYQWASDMIGRPGFRDELEPQRHAIMLQFIRANYRLNSVEVPLERQGSARWYAFSYLGILKSGKLTRIWGMQRDVTERRRTEEDLRQRTTELSALLAITRDLAGTLELEPLLENVLTRLRTVIDYSSAVVSMRERDDLVVVAYDGEMPRSSVIGVHTRFNSLLPVDQLMTTRQPVVLEDAGLTELVDPATAKVLQVNLGLEGMKGRSWLLAPLLIKNTLMGVLVLEHKDPRRFTARQAELAQAFADHAAVAIENARLYVEGRQLAALNERQRLAAELHDSVSQAIYSISLAAHTGLAHLEKRPERVRILLHRILELADAAFIDIRSLIFELRPDSLERHGLVTALERQAETLRSREHVQVHLNLGREPDLPITTKEALYRIAQEAMSNIFKHARAKAVWLRLAVEGPEVCLEVRDNGKGFDPNRDYAGHLGLRLMRERAQHLGGTVTIVSTPQAGTIVTTRLPFGAPE